MAEPDACPDCGRPHARDGCESCGRSRSAPWPLTTLVMGEGKGGPGRKRVGGRHGVRRFQLSFKLDESLAGRIKATASERGQTLGQVIRDLVEDGYRFRRGARLVADVEEVPVSTDRNDEHDAEYLARRAAFSRPGDGAQRPPERLRPVHQFGAFER